MSKHSKRSRAAYPSRTLTEREIAQAKAKFRATWDAVMAASDGELASLTKALDDARDTAAAKAKAVADSGMPKIGKVRFFQAKSVYAAPATGDKGLAIRWRIQAAAAKAETDRPRRGTYNYKPLSIGRFKVAQPRSEDDERDYL